MADLLARGAALVDAVRHESLARSVMYQRGANRLALVATVGSTAFDHADEYGVIHRIESRDYLLTAADLVLGGEVATPQAGDRITETDGTLVHEYEVMAPGGEPAWRYSDPQRMTLRIHTKFVRRGTA